MRPPLHLESNMKRKPAKTPKDSKFDQQKEVRAIARERIGPVKPGRTILPKDLKKPKHKKPPSEGE